MRKTILLLCTLVAAIGAAPAAHAVVFSPQIGVDDPYVPEKNAGTSAMTFHVTLSEAAAAPVTVKVATADGTATTPQDYVKVPSTTLIFAPGETDKAVPVSILGDTRREGSETLRLVLSKPSANAVIGDTSGQGTMYDVEAPRRITVGDMFVIEPGAGGETWAGFDVTLDPPPDASGGAGVDYTLVPGTAQFGSDWDGTELTGFVNLDEESRGRVQVVVRVPGDTLVEGAETLTIKLSNPHGAILEDSVGIGTIAEGSSTAPRRISVSDAWVVEGNSGSVPARFKVSLDTPATTPVSVKVATGNGTATADKDYTALASQTVTFAPGEQTRNVDVPVLGDTLHELQETLQLKLSQPTGAVLSDTVGTATITDNEGPIVGYVADAQILEDEGHHGLPIVMRYSTPIPSRSANTTFVSWTTQDGTANAGALVPDCGCDYFPSSGRVNSWGDDHRWVFGAVRNDLTVEPDETFFWVVTKAEGFVLGDAKATLTIVNDD